MKKLDKEKILRIKAMRAGGFTGKEIAQTLQVAERTIAYWVKRMREEGIEVNSLNKRGGKKIQLT